MRRTRTLILAALLSWFLAGVVQLQLGIWFNAHEELILAMMMLVLVVLIAVVALGVALAISKTVAGVNRTGLGLLAFVLLGLLALVGFTIASDGASTLVRDSAIFVEIFVPLAIVVLVQWWLVRRRWLKDAAA